MIKFKQIVIEGFGSIRDEIRLDLDRPGVNIVRGKNGGGKTTIFNALIWCLYGVNLKGLVNSKLPTKAKFRTDSFQGTRVFLVLEKDGKEYSVARHISYKGSTLGLTGGSDLMLFVGPVLSNDQHKADVQESIIKLLGIDSNIFINSILFGQRMKRFIEAKPQEKRKIFESIFDLDYIDAAKAKADEELTKLNNLLSSNNQDITSSRNKVLIYEGKIENQKVLIDQFKQTQQRIISDLENRKKFCQESLKSGDMVPRPIATKHEVIDYSDELNKVIRTLDADTLTLKFMKEPVEPSKVCSLCGSDVSEDKLKLILSEYQNKKEEYDSKISELQKSIDANLKLVESLTAKKEANKEKVEFNKKVDQDLDYNGKLQLSIDSLRREIDTINEKIKKESDMNCQVEDTSKLAEEVKNLKILIEEKSKSNQETLSRIEVVSWWSKVGFSSKGMKGYIMNSALQLLNKSILKYSSRLGFKVIFSIDTSKASKPFMTKCSRAKTEFDYDEFSGGEKARIDVAAAFAIHDLVSSVIDFNILIMDEVFEGLDNDGIEDVFDLVRVKAEGKSLYIITHSEQVDSLNTKRIDVMNDNNTTYIS